jgi:hypothetical protein
MNLVWRNKEAINQEARRDKKRAVNRDFSTDTGVSTSLRRLFAHTSERGYPALGAHASTFFD